MLERLSIVIVGLAGSLSAQQAVNKISPVFARYGIRAVTGNDMEFAAKLGPEVVSAMGDLRAHIGMIRNDGPYKIRDMTWVWTGIALNGQRIPLVNRAAVGSTEGIKAGGIYVTAPTFPLLQILMYRAKQPKADLSSLPAAVTELRNRLSSFTAVESSLDSVLLDNGAVVGPDLWGYIEARKASQAAMAQISAQFNDASVSDEELIAWLDKTAQQTYSLRPSGFPDHSTVIGSMTKGIQLQLKQHGRQKMADLFKRVVQQSAEERLVQVKE